MLGVCYDPLSIGYPCHQFTRFMHIVLYGDDHFIFREGVGLEDFVNKKYFHPDFHENNNNLAAIKLKINNLVQKILPRAQENEKSPN